MITMMHELTANNHTATTGYSACGMTLLHVRYENYVNGFRHHVYRVDQGFNTIAMANSPSKLDETLKADYYDCTWNQ